MSFISMKRTYQIVERKFSKSGFYMNQEGIVRAFTSL
jgi:hypothetical protein